MCSSAGCTTIANVFDPVVGSWEGPGGLVYLNLNMDGTGTMTAALGGSSSITWSSLGNGEYDIGGSHYSLKGAVLHGPLVSYKKV